MKKIIAVILAVAMCFLEGSVGRVYASDEVSIVLNDENVYVDGTLLEDNAVKGVYTARDIICVRDDYSNGYYYTSSSYGEYALSADEIHTAEEVAENVVVHITDAGVYRLSGNLSKGQIAVDLADTASASDSVELILDNVDINCDVAPAVIFYDVYEPYDGTVAEVADSAGAIVTIADNSVNNITGSHVGKTFKDETYAKKKYKYDGVFYSKMTMLVQSESNNEDNWGTLNINADNEGLDSELHLTINGGNINIIAANDGINVNEDYISTFAMNDGYLHIIAGCNGDEGDGIDSNGELYINGGTVITYGKNQADGGIDADGGIYLNGGVVAAFGGRNDSVESSSGQAFIQLTYSASKNSNITLLNKDNEEPVFVVAPTTDYTDVVISFPDLSYGSTYYVLNGGEITGSSYKGEIYKANSVSISGAVQQKYTSTGSNSGMPSFNQGPIGNMGPSNSNTSSNDFTINQGSNTFSGVSESTDKTYSGDVSKAKTEVYFVINGSTNKIDDVASDAAVELYYTGAYDSLGNEITDIDSSNIIFTVRDNPSEDFMASASLYKFMTGGAFDGSSILPTDVGNYILTIAIADNDESYTGTSQWEFAILYDVESDSDVTTTDVDTTVTNMTTENTSTTENVTENESTTEVTTQTTTETTTEETTIATTVAATEETTEATTTTTVVTTEETTVTTTTKTSSSSGGSGGKLVVSTSTTTTTTESTTTETTTEATTEDNSVEVSKPSIRLNVGDKSIFVGDKEYEMDAMPYIQASSNSVMVPLRFVAVALFGDDVSMADSVDFIKWNSESKAVTIVYKKNEIVFTCGKSTAIVNGKEVALSNGSVAEIVDSRLYIPFRAVGEILGANVKWDSESKSASYWDFV